MEQQRSPRHPFQLFLTPPPRASYLPVRRTGPPPHPVLAEQLASCGLQRVLPAVCPVFRLLVDFKPQNTIPLTIAPANSPSIQTNSLMGTTARLGRTDSLSVARPSSKSDRTNLM